jgi:hypothetical protein
MQNDFKWQLIAVVKTTGLPQSLVSGYPETITPLDVESPRFACWFDAFSASRGSSNSSLFVPNIKMFSAPFDQDVRLFIDLAGERRRSERRECSSKCSGGQDTSHSA